MSKTYRKSDPIMAKKATEATPEVHNEFTRYPYLDSEGRLTEKALYQLSKPFNPADLKWLPTDVKRNGDEETALALVYTDPRAYHERLDLVFGPGNWGSTISFTTAQFFKALPQKMGWGANKDKVVQEARDVVGYKLFAVATLNINGIGSKTSTGEEDTSDNNAATSAEAQAFKRACSQIGIGRYFYYFSRERMPYAYGKFTRTPELPTWAIPQPECADSGMPITAFTFPSKNGKPEETWPVEKLVAVSKKLYGVTLSGAALMERSKNAPKKPVASAKAEPAAVAAAVAEPSTQEIAA